MANFNLHVYVDDEVLKSTPGSLNLSRQVNGHINTVFQSLSPKGHPNCAPLFVKNTFTWTEEYEVVGTSLFAGGIQAIGSTSSWPIAIGQTAQWNGVDISRPAIGSNSVPVNSFAVSGLPTALHLGVKQNINGVSSFIYIHPKGGDPFGQQTFTPKNNFLLFWDESLTTSHIFNRIVSKAFLFSFPRGTFERHIRYGYAIPNKPIASEVPTWHDYQTNNIESELRLFPYSRTTLSGSNKFRPIIYASMDYYSSQSYSSHVTTKFCQQTKTTLLLAQNTVAPPLLRVRIDFADGQYTRKEKVVEVAKFIAIQSDPCLFVHNEIIGEFYTFTVTLKSKSPGFHLIKGSNDTDRVITLIKNSLSNIAPLWAPTKVDLRPIALNQILVNTGRSNGVSAQTTNIMTALRSNTPSALPSPRSPPVSSFPRRTASAMGRNAYEGSQYGQDYSLRQENTYEIVSSGGAAYNIQEQETQYTVHNQETNSYETVHDALWTNEYVDTRGTYSTIKDFHTVFLIDNSVSMSGQNWELTSRALSEIIPICTYYDQDGVDIYFLNHDKSYIRIRSAQEVMNIFRQVRTTGLTPTGKRISEILTQYISQCKQEIAFPKPLNLIVITDGEPSDPQLLESTIINTAKELDRMNADYNQCGIQFLQIGRNEAAAHYLAMLDDTLHEKFGVRDIVDTFPFNKRNEENLTGQEVLKIAMGAIDKRFDRQQQSQTTII
ncbi:hypothetical protein RUND412_011152 [Rhizina undulata]